MIEFLASLVSAMVAIIGVIVAIAVGLIAAWKCVMLVFPDA